MHTVKVFNNNDNIVKTNVEIDGKPLRRSSIDYHAELNCFPTFTFEVASLSDIEVNNADVRFKFCPETVDESVKILRHELIQHGDVYVGFLESIKSALRDMEKEMKIEDVSKLILSRIIGE